MSSTEISAFTLIVVAPAYVYYLINEIMQHKKGVQTRFRKQFSNNEIYKLAIILQIFILGPAFIISFFHNTLIFNSLIWSNVFALLLSTPYFIYEKQKDNTNNSKFI